jgi:hypothetical protein
VSLRNTYVNRVDTSGQHRPRALCLTSLTTWMRPRRLPVEAALNRCRALAAQIARELRNKRTEYFVDKLSLADLCASLEHAADVLGQKGRQPVENTPAPVEKGSRARHR